MSNNATKTNEINLNSAPRPFIGLFLSLLLLISAFYLVQKHLLPVDELYIAVVFLAFAQLAVQIFCFLRLHSGNNARWNIVTLLFTIVIIALVVTGSLWIMYNLNYNMMYN